MANSADVKVERDAGTTYARRYPTDQARLQLMEIAEFERECMQLAMRRLEQNVDGSDAIKKSAVRILPTLSRTV